MAKVSVSKLVETGAKKTAKTVSQVTKVAKQSTKAAASAVTKSTKAVTDVVANTTKETQQGIMKVNTKFSKFCDPNNIIPCITAITIVAYIVIVTPSTVLDIFGTTLGKSLSMTVVLLTLLFDLKLGVLLGLAAILSIALASINNELFETFTQEYNLENYSKPIDYILETPVSKCTKSKTKKSKSKENKFVKPDGIKEALEKENQIIKENVGEITGLDDHLKTYTLLSEQS